MDKRAAEIADSLNVDQKRFILACSTTPKKWMTIRRHAKIPDRRRVHSLIQPLRLVKADLSDMVTLTELGVGVKQRLLKK